MRFGNHGCPVQFEAIQEDGSCLIPSVPEAEGLREDGLDKSICSSPGGMHPQPEPPDLGTSRYTWVIGGLNGMQRSPLLVCKISNKWTGRSSCPMSIRFWSRSAWRLCLLPHFECLEYAELSILLLLSRLLPTTLGLVQSEQGSACPLSC